MTIVEQARLAGIRAQLAVRGRSLANNRTGVRLMALAQHEPGLKDPLATEGEYALGPEERTLDAFHVLRIDLGGTVIAVGDTFTNEQGQSFRVVTVGDSPNSLLVHFTVET